jgi:transposase
MKSIPLLLSIDVGSKELVTAVRGAEDRCNVVAYPNDLAGRARLVAAAQRLVPPGAIVRVGLEATGTYGLEIALLLSRTAGFEVSVINPKTIKNFLRAQGIRGKTDRIDAAGILRYLELMPFRRWIAPRESILALQGIGRRLYQLNAERIRELNRLEATAAQGAAGRIVAADLRKAIKQIEARLEALEEAALELIQSDPLLQQKYELLISITGIATKTAIRLLGELLVLDPAMKGPQWVAQAGLDPRVRQSGTSLDGHRYISKAGNRYIRAALYMPALVAIRRDATINARYRLLVEQAKKPKMIAIVAIMRKLLLCIHGMFKSNTPFDPTKLLPQPTLVAQPAEIIA